MQAVQLAMSRLGVQQPQPGDSARVEELHFVFGSLSAWAKRLTAVAAKESAEGAALMLKKARTLHKLESMGGVQIPVPAQAEDAIWACAACGRSCRTKAALAVHRSVIHGERASSNTAAGATCAVCHAFWWTTARLRQHVWSSATCAQVYAHAELDYPQCFEVIGTRRDLAWRPPVPDESLSSLSKLVQGLEVGSFEVWAKAAVEWASRTPNCTDLVSGFPEHEWSHVWPAICLLRERQFVSECVEVSDRLASGDGKHL